MKILIIGNGGREHAIACKVAENKNVSKIYCIRGNAGTLILPKCENININDDEILDFALNNKIDLTIVGSEELLAHGIVDKFVSHGLKIIGPDKNAARLESSKAWAKKFMKKYNIKTATYEIFDDMNKAINYIENYDSYPVVIKASGLAAGKGVIIAKDKKDAIITIKELMNNHKFGSSGDTIVIEEFLDGIEASILSITDSNIILPFISAKDHKKIYENETGPNTGGMGAIAPNPYVTDDVYNEFYDNILLPTLHGIKAEKMDFAGFIFFGLMITKKGVYLLEYNMRLGDPETQAVLPLLKNDLVNIILKAINKDLKDVKLEWYKKFACCVVLASLGYPIKYEKNFLIKGTRDVENIIYLAGTKKENNDFYTNGGRVLNVIALGDTLEEARNKVYHDIEKINFENKYYRKDIGILK